MLELVDEYRTAACRLRRNVRLRNPRRPRATSRLP